jgi:hypothetical protein
MSEEQLAATRLADLLGAAAREYLALAQALTGCRRISAAKIKPHHGQRWGWIPGHARHLDLSTRANRSFIAATRPVSNPGPD